MESQIVSVFPAQSTSMTSLGLCWMRIVALVILAHFLYLSPELCAHVRPLADLCAATALLAPEHAQCHAGLCQLLVDHGVVRFQILTLGKILPWKEDLTQVFVRKFFTEGPFDPCCFCCCENVAHGVTRNSHTCFDMPLAVVFLNQPQNFSVVYHLINLRFV